MGNNIIALIPARSGSKRIPNKNIKLLCGHPLLAYAIQCALDSKIFNGIYVSSDSERIGEIAKYYGAEYIHCPLSVAHKDNDCDAQWINHALGIVKLYFHSKYDRGYAIIRPTNPFRTVETIKRAYAIWDFEANLKAVDRVEQHPFKAWEVLGNRMYCWYGDDEHLNPTNTFPKLFYQNGSIEFRCNPMDSEYQPFVTEGYEGFDINSPEDWILAEALIEKGYAKLPEIDKKPYDFGTV